MPRKAFHIGIDLDIHAVSCPGVWLCPRGDAMLQISMLGASAHTKRVEPNFPLLFHESFHFRKTLTGVTTLAELQSELVKRVVKIQLVQWQVHGCRCVVLAAFRSPLSELLYPQPANRGMVAGVDVDLLMETSPCFPGIIAPKVEISTKVVIEDMVNYALHDHEPAVVNHKTLTSKRTSVKRDEKTELKSKQRARSALCGGPLLRQKPVCHTRPRVKCYSCKQRVTRIPKPRTQDDTHYIPYCNKCGDTVEEKEVKQGKVILKESDQHTQKWDTTCPCVEPPRSKSACDCNLCRKYYNLFKNSPPSSILSQIPKSPRSRFDRSPSPTKKDKFCPCLNDKADGVSRLRGTSQLKSDCPCVQNSNGNNSSGNIGDYINELLKRTPSKDEEYQNMLKSDLDTRYKKLYERVSRRNNRRQS